MNLVSTILQLLGPAIVTRLASSLGANQGVIGKAISAAVPAILAGLTTTASRGAGATQLSNAVAKQDPSILDNLGSLIGGPGQQSLVESGTNILSSLLGGSSTDALTGALSKFTGLSGAQGSSLIGMLAPVILGQLGQVQQSSSLGTGGLVSLLNSQKDNIADALPAGFAKHLSGTGLLDSLGDRVETDTTPARRSGDSGSQLNRWLLGLALAALALFLLSNYGCDRKTETVAPAPPTTTTPAQTPPATTNTALADNVSKALDSLRTTLDGVTDEATANAAVPQLQDIARQIDTVKSETAALPADARGPIASLVASALPGITAAVEKAVGIPGVAAILNPILQPLVANLDALAKT